jgi:hypothetical protein
MSGAATSVHRARLRIEARNGLWRAWTLGYGADRQEIRVEGDWSPLLSVEEREGKCKS